MVKWYFGRLSSETHDILKQGKDKKFLIVRSFFEFSSFFSLFFKIVNSHSNSFYFSPADNILFTVGKKTIISLFNANEPNGKIFMFPPW
jgi:hypothetical protein